MGVDITLNNVGSGYNRSAINENFEAIEEAFTDALSVTDGGTMQTDIDLNGNDLLNVSTLDAEVVTIDGVDVAATLDAAVAAAQLAEANAELAEANAEAAEAGAESAQTAAEEAADRAEDAAAAITYVAASITTTELNTLIASISASGGGYVNFLPTEYSFNKIELKNNVYLRGSGEATVLNCNPAVATHFIYCDDSVDDVAVTNMTINYQSNVAGLCSIYLGNDCRGALIEHVTFLGNTTRAAIRADYNSVSTNSGNITVRNNRLIDGQAAGLVTFLTAPTAKGIYNIRVEDNYIYGGGNMCMIANTATNDEDARNTFFNTIVSGNIFIGNGTGVDGPIPTELWGHTNSIQSNNVVTNATRGLGWKTPTSCVSDGNIFEDQSFYMFEVALVNDLVLSNNVGLRCRQLVAENTLVGNSYTTKGLKVIGNTIRGTTNTGVTTVDIISMTNGAVTRKDITIENNTFIDMKWARSIIRVDGNATTTDGIRVIGNTIISSEVEDPFIAISCRFGKNIEVKNNTIRFLANYTSSNPNYDTQPAAIQWSPNAIDGLLIEGNVIDFTGTAAGAGVTGIGNVGGSGTGARISIKKNTILGTYADPISFVTTDTDGIMEDNDVRRATGSDTVSAVVVYKSTNRQYTASSIPTSGTFVAGDFVWNTSPSSVMGWSRLTTGSAHVDGTDWKAIGPTTVYTEGTWTPVLNFGGATTGITYTTQLGRYTRTGRLVTATFQIVLSSKGSATGNATITGIPFTILNSNPRPVGSIGRVLNTTSIGAPGLIGNIGTSTITLYHVTSGTSANLADTNFGNTSEIYGSVTFEV